MGKILSLRYGAAAFRDGAARVHEAAQSDPQLHAQPHELVGPHGPLPVEHPPQAFAVDAYAARELGHADASLPARLLHPRGYEVDVLHEIVFSPEGIQGTGVDAVKRPLFEAAGGRTLSDQIMILDD